MIFFYLNKYGNVSKFITNDRQNNSKIGLVRLITLLEPNESNSLLIELIMNGKFMMFITFIW